MQPHLEIDKAWLRRDDAERRRIDLCVERDGMAIFPSEESKFDYGFT
jgi:hypothetical protein